MVKAKHQESVEYILCVDARWGFDKNNTPISTGSYLKVVWNEGRKCMVDGFNTAAKASTGQILILVSDDMFPPEGWDELLLDAIVKDEIETEDHASPMV